MAYIYLEELKKILPDILDQWIDKDDESWEWIFQEIEQKCHVGKRCKGKKWRKKLRDDVDELQYFRHNEYEIKVNGIATRVNELTKKVDVLNNKISNLDDRHAALVERVNHIRSDITAAKSMAETAKNRTEVKYNEIGIDKKPPHISYTLWSSAKHMLSVFEQRGATKEELEQLDFLFSKYILDVNMCDSQWRKEHKQELNNLAGAKDCKTCKYNGRDEHSPCISCDNTDKWEVKNE